MAQQTKETFLLFYALYSESQRSYHFSLSIRLSDQKPTGTVYRGTSKQDYRVCVQMNARNRIAEKRAYAKKQYVCEWR
jgi:hypothetical protein